MASEMKFESLFSEAQLEALSRVKEKLLADPQALDNQPEEEKDNG